MPETMQLLDTSGLSCPLPVLKAKKALKALGEGDVLTVIATDPASYIDFEHYCHISGNALEKYSEQDGVFTYIIRKSARP
ncbi:MAG: sulfurtransferase tusA [Sneathiella sp.]|nr:MAG: sulfurtransferase tusA [Sneathiella sp.]